MYFSFIIKGIRLSLILKEQSFRLFKKVLDGAKMFVEFFT